MNNNDVLRSVRFILNIRDATLVEILELANYEVSLAEVVSFLKKEEDEGFEFCSDEVLAHFLNGLVTYRRGKDDTRPPQAIEMPITNNTVLKKLRVAFELKDDDIIAIIGKTGVQITKTELSAFFRSPDHRNYRDCGNQFLRNFLKNLVVRPIPSKLKSEK